ncbi:C45 family autoproteolytic acyltransferase/hydrolase [Algoriphagus sp. AGSA1]|uniref:C45 family autoproteolytic acyltransferase/hydolase n=1 Tax=Algoriphagus sp. AGSA1 TaxID=2907213 RepID=UPI001F3AD148|nr:C45 family autoproteolytic acyltransferase/hydolase [Algoriphagus sp. AGSA1]MCE7056476.1 C45 family autoproteolytic acyltransferase/hydrolase [Algoriphagus sp. AGSA1]
MQKKKLILLGGISLLLILPLIYIRITVYPAPDFPVITTQILQREEIGNSTFRYKNNWLRKNEHGNWESYIEGTPYERGIALGILHKELIQSQETAFIAEIEKLLPSKVLRTVMQLGIGWFNRNLDQNIPLEYLQEIYMVSQSFSDEYSYVGPKFNRILNYHAAHDIGHMAQNMNLVACTAVAQWDFGKENPKMVLGRNFDFYFGDEFAKDKIVLFVNPSEGYDFVSVTWGGFSGVVSGMNEKGLSVTLNALPSELPVKSATPVSIIAREVVQYASTIEEALDIISKYKVFVSESFTIASAIDQKAAVIEKTPEKTAIFYPEGRQLIVANHFQSEEYKNSQLNLDHIRDSESMSRFDRMGQLTAEDTSISVDNTLRYIRDQKGMDGQDIGMGNPMAINQLLAHHAVIFEPLKKIAYISAAPFQENVFQAYNVSSIKNLADQDLFNSPEIDSLRLDPDPFFSNDGFLDFAKYKRLKEDFLASYKTSSPSAGFIEKWISTNPGYYEPYYMLGRYYFKKKEFAQAKNYYEKALNKAIPYRSIKTEITENMEKMR